MKRRNPLSGQRQRFVGLVIRCAGAGLTAVMVCVSLSGAEAVDSYSFVLKWGSRGDGDGQFDRPNGIAVDSSGNVYVADTWNHRIQKFSSSGVFLGKWGSFGTGSGNFNAPLGIAVDSSGNIYVLDSGNHRVQKFDSSMNSVAAWGSAGSGDGQFGRSPLGGGPCGIAVHPSAGYVFVADTWNHRIQKFDSSGNFLEKWGSQGDGDGEFDEPRGIAVGSFIGLYVSEWANHRVQVFDLSGKFLRKWGAQGIGDGWFNSPWGVAVDRGGMAFPGPGGFVGDSGQGDAGRRSDGDRGHVVTPRSGTGRRRPAGGQPPKDPVREGSVRP